MRRGWVWSAVFAIGILGFFLRDAVSQDRGEEPENGEKTEQESPLGGDFMKRLRNPGEIPKADDSQKNSSEQNGYSRVPDELKETVADVGDPRNLEIRGAKTFKADDIKKALFGNLTVRYTSVPSADFLQCKNLLKNAAVAGYRQAGFPYPKIAVRTDRKEKRFRMEIEEGDRYLAGEILARGATGISAEKLAARLQSKHAPASACFSSFQNVNGEQTEVWVDASGNNVEPEPPVWTPGKPAAFVGWTDSPADSFADAFVPNPAAKIDEDVQKALEEQGFFFAKFRTQYELDKDKKTAALAIDVLNEGPRAEIGSIEVVGNEKNTEEEVLNYLGVRPGMPFAREDLLRLNKKLWDAARFMKAKVTPMRPASADDKLLLRIELVEYTEAPSLSKPFSPEEQAMIKFGEWLRDNRRWDGDLKIRVDSESNFWEFVQSREDGSYARIHYGYPQTNGEKGLLDYEAIFTSKETGFYSAPQRRKFVTQKSNCISSANFGIRFNEDRNSDTLFFFGYGFKFNSPSEKVESPRFDMRLQLPPACCVALLHYENPEFTLNDGVLSLSAYGSSCKIEAETGRVLSMSFDSELVIEAEKAKKSKENAEKEGEKAASETPDSPEKSNADEKAEEKKESAADKPPEEDPPLKFELHFAQGAFKEAAERVHRDAADFDDECDADRRLASFLAFFCKEPYFVNYVKEQGCDENWLLIAQRFLAFGALDPLEAAFDKHQDDGKNLFEIPCDPAWKNCNWNIANPASYGCLGVIVNDDLFPTASWPWTIVEQAAFVGMGMHGGVNGEGYRLYNSPESGPLCFLAMATLMDYWNSLATKTFAQRGLERLDKNAFLADCKPLLSKDHQAGMCLRKAVEAYRFFTPGEVRALAEKMDPKNLKYLAICDEILRADAGRNFDDVMPELLGALWDAGLKEQIELALVHLLNDKEAKK